MRRFLLLFCALIWAGFSVSSTAQGRADATAAGMSRIEPNDQRLGFLGRIAGQRYHSQGMGILTEFKLRDDGGLDIPATAGYRLIAYVDAGGKPRAYFTAGVGKREGKLELGASGFKFTLDGLIYYFVEADKGDLHFLWMQEKSPEPKLIMYQRYAAPRPNSENIVRQSATGNRVKAELLMGMPLSELEIAINRTSALPSAPPVSLANVTPPTAVASEVAAPTFAAQGPRVALVVGNSSYDAKFGKLANPLRDAQAVTVALRAAGFEVELVQDADQKGLKRALTRFGQRLSVAGKNGTGLFFYAGHGVQSSGSNYLVPIGAAIETEADVDLEAVPADAVLRQMEMSGISTSIVILDACRNMPLARGSRDTTRGLARMDAPNGSFVAYSTAPGSVAADGAGTNSPFTAAFVREIGRPGETIQSVFLNVRRSVFNATGGKQVPWESSSLLDTFIFTPR